MNEEQTSNTEKENSRKDEVKVGLRNALDRKETLEKAKQSLIKAGYKSQIVEAASKEIETTAPAEIINQKQEKTKFKKIERPKEHKIKQKKQKPIKQKEQKKEGDMQKLPKTVEAKPKKKKIAIYIIISIIILVLAALLGLYWDSLIGMF